MNELGQARLWVFITITMLQLELEIVEIEIVKLKLELVELVKLEFVELAEIFWKFMQSNPNVDWPGVER